MIGCVKGYMVLGLSKQLRERKDYILGFAVMVRITSNFENTIKFNNNSSLSDSLISLY